MLLSLLHTVVQINVNGIIYQGQEHLGLTPSGAQSTPLDVQEELIDILQVESHLIPGSERKTLSVWRSMC